MRIAALDDEPLQLELIKRTMVSIGHECHTFDHGEALLRELRKETFDLLILDWQLPDISGPDVVRWVRSNLDRRIQIICLTVEGRQKFRRMAKKHSAWLADVMAGFPEEEIDELGKRLALLKRAVVANRNDTAR